MQKPWKVVGFLKWLNENGEECVRLFVERALDVSPDQEGAGLDVNRLYYKSKYVPYPPKIGDIIIAIDGKYGVNQIFVIGHEDGSN